MVRSQSSSTPWGMLAQWRKSLLACHVNGQSDLLACQAAARDTEARAQWRLDAIDDAIASQQTGVPIDSSAGASPRESSDVQTSIDSPVTTTTTNNYAPSPIPGWAYAMLGAILLGLLVLIFQGHAITPTPTPTPTPSPNSEIHIK